MPGRIIRLCSTILIPAKASNHVHFFDIFPYPAVASPSLSLPSNQISNSLNLSYSSITAIIKLILMFIEISSV